MTEVDFTKLVYYASNALLGFFSPYVLQWVKKIPVKVFEEARVLQVLSGFLGTGIAFALHWGLTQTGILSIEMSAAALWAIGWGINQTTAQLGYRTLIKK